MSEKAGPNSVPARFPRPLDAWWNPRRKRFWAWVILLLYTLAGFLLAPWVAKRELLALIESETGLPASVEELRINPFVLSAEAKGFQLSEPDGSAFIQFERLFLNFQLSSVIKQALVFREVSLESPQLNVVRAEDGSINLGRLAGQPGEPADADAAGGLLRLVVGQLDISNGELDLLDQVPATDFETAVGPINVSLSNLSTLPEDSGQQSVAISTPNGARLEWSGDISVNPVASRGRVTGSGPYLPLVYRYLRDGLNFEVLEGNAEIGFDYRIDWPAGAPLDLEISALDLDVRGLRARAASPPEDFLELPEVSVRGGYLRLGERAAGAESYLMRSPRVRLARYADGSLSLEKLLVAAPAEDSQAEPVSDADVAPDAATVSDDEIADDWKLSLARLEIDQLSVEFEDQALRGEPARFSIDPLRILLTDLSNTPEARIPVLVSAVLASGGRAELNGDLTVLPSLSLSSELVITQLELPVVQPYLSEVAQMQLSSATLDASFALAVTDEDPLSLDGGLTIKALEIADAIEQERLFGWQSMAMDRARLSLAANTLDISELKLVGPYARILIAEDASTNVQALLVEQPPTPADAPPAADPLALSLARVAIEDGSADFTDLSLPFPFATKIAELGGEISSLSTSSQEPASVGLQGKVGEYGLAEISGSLSPSDPTANTDLRVLFRNVELPDLSPYTVKFAGRKIQDGRLELDLRYRLDGGQLQGDNSVIIDRLTLGEKQDYPGAANLPLGLAVALLKKPDGTIDLDLPISGDVNDPEFSVGGVVFRAFANLITKLVTSPFRLLGGLVGAGDEEIDLIEFRAGEAELTPPELEKLAKLGEALVLRPQLAVDVPGVVDKEADGAALRAARVEAAVDALLAAETGRKAEQLLNQRRRRVLEQLAGEQLPEGAVEAARAAAQIPEQADDPDSKLVLDEPAYLAKLGDALTEAQQLSDADLQSLADQRAAAVAAALIAVEGVDADRVRLLPAAEAKLTDGGWIPLKLGAEAAASE